MEPISHDRLAGISAFVAAVEAGSFAQAAARLGQTRSAVGKAIGRLEARLGTRLFVRTARRLALTDDGQAFYERCAPALEELDSAQNVLEAGRREASGRIRISAPVVFGRHHVTPLLLDLMEKQPRLRIEGHFTDRVVDFADEGIDIAIRSGVLPDSDTLIARPLGMQAMVVCASPGYLGVHGVPRSAGDLARHRCIVYLHGDRPSPWMLTEPDGRVMQPLLPYRLGFSDIDSLIAAALHGAGLVHVPEWLVRDALSTGALIRVLDRASSTGTPMHVVWPGTRFLPYKLRVTIDAMLAAIPPLLAPAVQRTPGVV
ncbi:LysR family transcriptional regulator [Paraburkholderia sp. MMS20-SJTN17]|uniref:LysR family transcriptional regulator n=1 Tax=Paraburkholderia translucens TaxID=2886945 RepID=A0ABS8KIL9_9BURK|nr:LysR family transcriptional regulator [Paraburkholderia sp. MMS20-SJTN17]MCC8404599.1 LysR family transcriptional regulator [Paraburkholderia sp. MMS20-SJTN17]